MGVQMLRNGFNRSMDLNQTIRQLHAEKERLDQVIAALEQLQRTESGGLVRERSPRGRKSMAPAERQQVSARMKAYWAKKRGRRKTPPNSATPSSGSPYA